MRISVLTSAAIGATIASAAGHASCADYETLVRGRVIRCESANFHVETLGANVVTNRRIDEGYARAEPEGQDRLRDRLHPRPVADLVAVVALDWQVTIAPWLRDVSATVELYDRPQKVREIVRYWWNGPADACQAMTPGTSADLWVYLPCCDTLFGLYPCFVGIRYAEPAPEPMRDALSTLLEPREP